MKLLLLLFSLILLPFSGYTQEKEYHKFEIGISGGLSIIEDDPALSYGINARYLIRMRNEKLLLPELSFDRSQIRRHYMPGTTYNVMLFTLGYRRGNEKFFWQPQLGGGIGREDGSKFLDAFFHIGMETGLIFGRKLLGFRYRFGSTGDLIFGESFHQFTFVHSLSL